MDISLTLALRVLKERLDRHLSKGLSQGLAQGLDLLRSDVEKLRGPQGEEGPIGPRGPEGLIGPVGPKGELGDRGEKGDRGLQGPRGWQGEIGPMGRRGERGAEGQRGPKGDRGPAGPAGPPGPAPKHQWSGPKLRFQNPDGSWGTWTDLQGRDGRDGRNGGGGMGGASSGSAFDPSTLTELTLPYRLTDQLMVVRSGMPYLTSLEDLKAFILEPEPPEETIDFGPDWEGDGESYDYGSFFVPNPDAVPLDGGDWMAEVMALLDGGTYLDPSSGTLICPK